MEKKEDDKQIRRPILDGRTVHQRTRSKNKRGYYTYAIKHMQKKKDTT